MTKRILVMIGCITAALVCYLINIKTGAIAALVFGGLCELAFWFNLVQVDCGETIDLIEDINKDQ